MQNHWVILDGPKARHFEFALNLYSGRELEEMLRIAGFGSVAIYGSLEGAPYDATAKRLVAVARQG